MAEFTGFCGPTYSSRSRDANAQRCINLFPEVDTHGGNKRYVLYGTPGVEEFAYIGTDPVRGMHVLGSYLYVVAGDKLYRVSNTGVASGVIGTLLTSTGPVCMSDNGVAPTGGNQMIISDGIASYVVGYNNAGGSPIDISSNELASYSSINYNTYGAGQTGSTLNIFVEEIPPGGGLSGWRIPEGTVFKIDDATFYVNPSDVVTTDKFHFRTTSEATTDASGYVTLEIDPAIDIVAPGRNMNASPVDGGVVRVVDYVESFTVNGAGQTGSTLNIFVESEQPGIGKASRLIPAGTLLKIDDVINYVTPDGVVTTNKMYVVVMEDATTDASGNAALSISPSLDVSGDGQNISASPTDGATLQIVEFAPLYHLAAYTNCSVNGVFVIDTADETGRFRTSDLYSGFIFNDLAIGTAESRPDALRAVYNYRSALVLFGDFTIEVHNYVGSGYPPFVKDSGGTIDHGIAARYSIAESDNSVLWLARNKNGGVYVGRSSGGAPQVVSTPALEHEWGTYLSISDAFAYAYTDRGHSFYVITFPAGGRTFAYDLTTNEWHERSTYEGDPYHCGRHLGSAYAYFNGLHLIGDYRNGQLYKMSMDYYTDNGEPIVSVRRAPHIDAERKRVIINRLEVVAETGTVTDSSEPQMRMRISRDGGYTWSSEKWRSMGKQGEYGKRIQWFNQGAAREAVVEIAISAPIKKVILGANIDVEALDA